jgi:hypothetical protein
MSLELDAVNTGDWLICVRGFKTMKMTALGDRVEVIEHATEGVLFRVLAVSGPIVFLKVHPVPCGGTDHQHEPWNGVFKFNDMEWIKASAGFVRTYIRESNLTPPRAPRSNVSKQEAIESLRDLLNRPPQDPPDRRFR